MPPSRTISLKALGKNLLLLGVVTLVCLALAEVAARVAGAGGRTDPELSGAHAYDSLLGWRNVPLSTQMVETREYRISERFNSRSVRGPERTIPRPRGVRRVLLLGDSFVEGYTVDAESTSAAVLERLLAEGGAPAEVINGGTAGYSTDQELLAYRSLYRAYQPDVVVLLPYVNDIWYNTQTRYWRGFKPRFTLASGALTLTNVPVPRPQPDEFAYRVEGGRGLAGLVRRFDAWLGRHSVLYQVVRRVLTATPVLSGTLIRLGFAAVPGEFRPWHAAPDSALADAWRVTEALLAELRDEVGRDGARLVVFHVPARPAVYDDDWRRTRQTYAFDQSWNPRQEAVVLRDICARQRLLCVFPEAAFRREASRLTPSGGRLYFAQDAHWTASGNALAARMIAQALADSAARPATEPRAGRPHGH
jgi:hypothetical protein